MNTNKLKGEIIGKFGTQEAFGEAMGWHRNKVSAILNHKYIPDVNEAARMADTLDLSKEVYIEIFLPHLSPNGDKKIIA